MSQPSADDDATIAGVDDEKSHTTSEQLEEDDVSVETVIQDTVQLPEDVPLNPPNPILTVPEVPKPTRLEYTTRTGRISRPPNAYIPGMQGKSY